jgi:hypothetical protein
MLIREFGQKVPTSDILASKHEPAADTAAVVTLAALAGQRRIIHGIQWSYSAAPTGGLLTVTDGGVIIFAVGITAAGPGGYQLTLPGSINSAVVVTLATGAGTVVGKLSVQSSVIAS